MTTSTTEKLKNLFEKQFGESVKKINMLPVSGSKRKYFRLENKNHKAIGTYNDDPRENEAFLYFSRHFKEKGLAVPGIYITELEHHIYLQEDLGDETLFSFLSRIRQTREFPNELIYIYKNVLEHLIAFQVKGHEGADYSIAYPRHAFDKQSMLWDLNYFKHYFIKLAGVSFYEQDLENDFHELTDYLLTANTNYFLYRDFQSRNIMLKNDKLFFIDYQGGRKGALQYDLASLLYDAKADIPQSVRAMLLKHYLNKLKEQLDIDEESFIQQYYGYVLIRIMQAFGAYGYRGFFERKQHFLQSIPYGLKNLEYILKQVDLPVEIPTLRSIFKQMITSPNLKELMPERSEGLTILINSFSYKRYIPLDNTGNGGGFVFDCRSLPNPGRIDQYKELTGNDDEVIAFLSEKNEVSFFLEHCFALVNNTVVNYYERGFNHLMVSFGCTGGQHRSVYCANKLHEYLSDNPNIRLKIRHIEQEIISNEKIS